MAKKTRKTKTVVDSQGWGTTTTEIAPEPAAPPAIVLPEPAEAVQVLQRLAEQNAKVLAAKTKLEEAQALTKQRRGKYEQEAEALSAMLREATSAPSMPLFDAAQSEADLRAMEQAIETAASSGHADAGATTDDADGGHAQLIPDEALNASNGPSAAEVF